jgi:hypothetical protein
MLTPIHKPQLLIQAQIASHAMTTGPSIPGIKQPAFEVAICPHIVPIITMSGITPPVYHVFPCGRTALPYKGDEEELPWQIPYRKNSEHITLL